MRFSFERHKLCKPYFLSFSFSFLFRFSLPFGYRLSFCSTNIRKERQGAQIRLDSWVHQVNFDLSKSALKRSEQICSQRPTELPATISE
jgi:hypothetical protein